MRAVYKRPGEPARIIDVENTLEALQEKVEGYIETLRFGKLLMLVNEEGKIRGMKTNFWYNDDLIAGPVLIVDTQGEEFTGLSMEAAKRARERLNRVIG